VSNKDDDTRLDDVRFGSIAAAHFDRRGCGPMVCELQVRANVHPSKSWPCQRIYVGAWAKDPKEMDFGGMIMTVGEARKLRQLLAAAIAEAVKNAPHLVQEVDDLDAELLS
jgi:hypothetical protein